MVTLLVNTPRVRVLSEEGQPLSVQISVHWSSATDMVPDVYQVRQGTVLPACQYLSWGLTPHEHLPPPLCWALLTPWVGSRWPGERRCPKDNHYWDLSVLKRISRTVW